jgi:Ca2+-binding RTX toxin-like protein
MKLLLATAALLIATNAHASEIIKQTTLAPDGSCAQTIFGTAGADVIDESGSSCDETIFGLGGGDTLIGGSGNDFLNGGSGADTMTGNGGVNTYVYSDVSDSGLFSTDYIYGFNEASDFIDLSAICPNNTTGCTFIGRGTSFTGHAGEIRYKVHNVFRQGGEGHITNIEGDFDGDGTAEFITSLDGGHTLTSANFRF